jgi:hypothetical protein
MSKAMNIIICFVGVVFIFSTLFGCAPLQTTPLPETHNPIEQVIAQTANAAQTQTQAFYTPEFTPTVSSPTAVGTSTFTPTVTMVSGSAIPQMQTQWALTPVPTFEFVAPNYSSQPAYVPPYPVNSEKYLYAFCAVNALDRLGNPDNAYIEPFEDAWINASGDGTYSVTSWVRVRTTTYVYTCVAELVNGNWRVLELDFITQ